jgi:glycine cleavage system transcriptional repressor
MILFLVGKDRPGIVDDVSGLLFEKGANIEDSRMASMGGSFSIMTLFSCTGDELRNIESGIEKFKKMGFEVSLHEAEDPSAVQKRPELQLKIEVTAMDHPGIVQRVVHILRQHDVNVESLNTQVTRAPLSGAPIFDLALEAGVPVEKSVARIKEELTKLAAEMNLDLNFTR